MAGLIPPFRDIQAIKSHQFMGIKTGIVENMAPLADGPSDCRFAATSGVSKAFDRPPRKAIMGF
jgi:hypothetical protein